MRKRVGGLNAKARLLAEPGRQQIRLPEAVEEQLGILR